MKSKWLLINFLFLVFIITFCFHIEANGDQEIITCLEVVKSEINDLRKLDGRRDILDKSRKIVKQLSKCDYHSDNSDLLIRLKESLESLEEPSELELKGNKSKMEVFVKARISEIDSFISRVNQEPINNENETNKKESNRSKLQIAKPSSPLKMEIPILNVIWYLLIVIILIGLTILTLLIFFRKEFKSVVRETIKIPLGIRTLKKIVMDLNDHMAGTEKEILKRTQISFKTLEEKITKNMEQLAVQLKELREEGSNKRFINFEERHHHDSGHHKMSIEDNYSKTPFDTEPKKDYVKIDFPKELIAAPAWKNSVISLFWKKKAEINDFLQKVDAKEIVVEWLRDIGKQLEKNSNADQYTFLVNIHQSIDTMNRRMARADFQKIFWEIFLKPFFNILEVEQFGRDGENFNPYKYEVMPGSRLDTSNSNTIKKIIAPGYKKKYLDEVLVKAKVEL